MNVIHITYFYLSYILNVEQEIKRPLLCLMDVIMIDAMYFDQTSGSELRMRLGYFQGFFFPKSLQL